MTQVASLCKLTLCIVYTVNVILGVLSYTTNLGLPLADVNAQMFISQISSSSVAYTRSKRIDDSNKLLIVPTTFELVYS